MTRSRDVYQPVAGREFIGRFATSFRDHYTARMAEKPQFSLQWLFVAIAAVAVTAAEAAAFPPSFAQVFGLAATALLPGAFVTGIVYARGGGKAFCIGALVCWLAAICMLAWRNPYFVRYGGQLDFCLLWSLTFGGGLLAVVLRWLALSKSSCEPE